MLLLLPTAREGRLSTDAGASLQTGWVPRYASNRRAVVCLGAELAAPQMPTGVKIGDSATRLNRR
jgi:hypothetical protein